MTKATLRHQAHNYSMKPFEAFCSTCNRTTKHQPMCTTFGESKEGPTIEKLGYCSACHAVHEKISVIKPVAKDSKKKAPRQEFCLVG